MKFIVLIDIRKKTLITTGVNIFKLIQLLAKEALNTRKEGHIQGESDVSDVFIESSKNFNN